MDDLADAIAQKQILFFLNPNGRPCQMQDQIIKSMESELYEKASVVYINTTKREDKSLFIKYGVRSLPAIIITDNNGKELKRFLPGIQDKATIFSAL